MKKICILFFILLIMVGVLCSCTSEENNEKELTLMIYMVGSDLEAKAAAGTNDLDEILNSEVDLSLVNVVVYAGGTPAWHNGMLMPENHTVMSLTETAFQNDKTLPSTSMGESDCLSVFLNYAYTAYPAKSYALILWDHGNGPIIGYGKDMLFGNDALTLTEMQTALQQSPFGSDNKLAWVGFDACLMASAELVHVWSDFAEYLVASQEVEPSFGWDYSFLTHLGKKDTEDLLKHITEGYLSACEAYYESRGFSERDTTLSCTDLSKTAQLSEAIENLFRAAQNTVPSNYNLLASRRAKTRALGRASTGSEYDLIDLGDMAAQLLDLFPTECSELLQILEEAVISNATNTEGCTGLSIYYPFFNKTYYEAEWEAAYRELGVFPEYLSYLQVYGGIWTKDNFITDVAQSSKPSLVTEESYQLELTKEQADTFASARFIVMSRQGEELYLPHFSSKNVTLTGTTLTATFDGNIIYAKDKYNRYVIPVSYEQDRVGNISRYRVPVYVTTLPPTLGILPDNYESKNEYLTFQLAVNTETKKLEISALTTDESVTDATVLMGGKLEDVDISQYRSYEFIQQKRYYLSRFDNGTVRPLSQWSALPMSSATLCSIEDGLEFEFSQLTAGEYYLIFEIEDTQGNRYCSEVLPIESSGAPKTEIFPPPVIANWNKEDSINLGSFEGVTVNLKVKESLFDGKKLVVSYTNTNEFPVYVVDSDVFVNKTVYTGMGFTLYGKINPRETIESECTFGTAEPYLETLSSLRFILNMYHGEEFYTLVKDQEFQITLPDLGISLKDGSYGSGPADYAESILGIKAEQQVLWQKDGVTVTLMGLGGSGGQIRGILKIENRTDEIKYLQTVSLALDGICLPLNSGGTISVFPNSECYEQISVLNKYLEASEITSASSATIHFRTMRFATVEGGGGFSEFYQAEVSLSQKGASAILPKSNTVLFEESGVQVSLLKCEMRSSQGCQWTLSVVNKGDQDITLDCWDIEINGTAVSNTNTNDFNAENNKLCAGESAVIIFVYYKDITAVNRLSTTFCLRDLGAEKVLYTGETRINWISEGVPLK